MSEDLRKLDGVEEALLELEAAEEVGLFSRTRVDAPRLVAQPSPVSRAGTIRFALRLLPVAAAVAMVVGAGTWMFRGGIHSTAGPETTITSIASAGYGSFHGCFGGPKGVVSSECLAHDYDSDGDVDLADFRAYQVACLESGQTR